MRVVVLGARGQLGSRILASALGSWPEAVGTSRSKTPGLIRFDPARDGASTLGRCDVLVNAVGAHEETREDSFESVHVDVARNIAVLHEALGRPRVVQLSALGARPDHTSRFFRTKAIGDALLLDALGDRVRVVQPTVVCTPGSRLVTKVRKLARLGAWARGRIVVPEGLLETQLQPVLAVDLVASVLGLAFEREEPRRTVLLAGADRLILGELVELAFRARGQDLRAIELPMSPFRIAEAFVPDRFLSSGDLELLREPNVLPEVAPDGARLRTGGTTRSFFEHALGRG